MQIAVYQVGSRTLRRIGTSRRASGSYSVARYTPGELHLEFASGDPCAARIAEDMVVTVDGWAYLVERVENTVGSTSRVTVGGRQLVVLLKRRQILPDMAAAENMPTGFDSVAGATETVMKHYVQNHAVTPVNPARVLPCVEIAVDRKRGIADDAYHARYVELQDTVCAIGKAAQLALIGRVDATRGKLVFDVEGQTDRTIRQSERPPLLLRVGDGRVDRLSIAKDVQGAANVFYCSRAGDRYAYETLTQTYFAEAKEPSGLKRREVALAISTSGDGNQYEEMRQNAAKLMPDYAEHRNAECVVAPTLVFGRDYTIGEVASIVDPRGGDVYNAEITAVTVSESEAARQVSVTFGEPQLTRFAALERKIKTEV